MADKSIFDEGAASVAPTTLEEIKSLAKLIVDRQNSVDEIEEALSKEKAELNRLKTVVIPDAMAKAVMMEFTMEDGTKISVDDFVSGSIPKDEEKRKVALETLIAEGGKELIKSEISLTFGKSQHNEAIDLFERLKAMGHEPTMEEAVNAQSLMAFVRDKIKNGEEVKYDKLGCFVGKTTKIKFPKKKS